MYCVCQWTSRGTYAPPKMYLSRVFWGAEIGKLDLPISAPQTATQTLQARHWMRDLEKELRSLVSPSSYRVNTARISAHRSAVSHAPQDQGRAQKTAPELEAWFARM